MRAARKGAAVGAREGRGGEGHAADKGHELARCTRAQSKAETGRTTVVDEVLEERGLLLARRRLLGVDLLRGDLLVARAAAHRRVHAETGQAVHAEGDVLVELRAAGRGWVSRGVARAKGEGSDEEDEVRTIFLPMMVLRRV